MHLSTLSSWDTLENVPLGQPMGSDVSTGQYAPGGQTPPMPLKF